MKAKEERKDLEKLLKNSPQEINGNVPQPGKDIPELQPEPIMNIDFFELKSGCESEARIMINNAISFILPIDMIENNEYLKNKLEVDIISLAGMIYQLRINEIMQKSLVEQVNLGMINPRMWEVFGQLSKIIGDLNKQLLQTTEAIKETYKTFKADVREQRTEALGPQQNVSGMITTGDGGVVTRGTKELINRVKKIKDQARNEEFLDDAQLVPNIPIDPDPTPNQ